MLPINREDLETLKRLPAIRFGCKTVQHKATQSLLCGAKRNNGAVPQSRANLSHRYESRPLQQRVQLSGAEKNAIRFLVVLTGLLVLAGIGNSNSRPVDILLDPAYNGLIVAGALSIFPLFAGIVAPEFYEMTMRGSIPILKASLLLALLFSVASAFTGSLPLALFAIVFTVSPVFYDFFRDLFFQQVPREVPWPERGVGTRILELLVEAALSAIIGLAVVLLITGHL